jgi:hypothetical protein
MGELRVLAASSRPCPMYVSDAILSFEVVNISLMQFRACT